MSKKMPYDRTKPYNTLPALPPLDEKVKDLEILEKLGNAKYALGKLDGIIETLVNPQMLINTITLREAKDSSGIENIFTSHDDLYQALAIETTEMSVEAREVLKYREALDSGFKSMQQSKTVNMQTILATYQKVKETTNGIRPPSLPTTVKKGGSSMTSGEVIYTPPRGPGIIENKLENWIEYCNDDDTHNHDALIKLAVSHYQFEAIHPFDDGNGRTGRILNILLLNQKELLKHPVLYLSGYIVQNKNEYYEKLGAVTERFAWKPWIMFIVEGIEQTCYYTIQLIEQINELYDSVKTYILEQNPSFNQEIIKLMFFQPYIKATHIVETPECGIGTRQTATTKLDELERMKMLVRKTVGRETVYINHQLISVLSS